MKEPTDWGFPRLFYLWGHAYEFEAKNNWDQIEKLLSMIGGHDEIWYATNLEIYNYVKAYEALRFDVAGKLVYNPTCTDVYFECNGKKVLAPAGKNVSCQ